MIRRNLMAQGYSQSVTLAVQLGTVPFLLFAWGAERFGVWLLLTAIPAYLALADFGFTSIAKNDMSMRVAAGDRSGALVTYQSILALLLVVCGALLIILGGVVWLVPWDVLFNLAGETVTEARGVLSLQFGAVLLYQFFLLLCAGLRSEGRAATETMLSATGRLVEALALVITALLSGGLIAAAFAVLAVRVGLFVGAALWLRRVAPWLRGGFAHYDGARLRSLSGPSLSYMLVPLGSAFLIQAPLVILGALSTPTTVALYSVTRTVARLGMSGSNLLSYAFTPEYSYAHGASDPTRFRRALVRHTQLFLAGFGLYLVIGLTLAPTGVRLISGGHIDPVWSLSVLLVAAVAAEMLWTSLLTPLVAVNEHGWLPVLLLLPSVAGLALGFVFSTAEGLALAGLAAHAVILMLVAKAFITSGIWIQTSRGAAQ